jgi:hypothetical protein
MVLEKADAKENTMPKAEGDIANVKTRKRKLHKGEINLEELGKVARLHATKREIAEWFRCSMSVLDDDPYHSVIIQAQNETKQRLKQKALQRALEESSDQMLVFCLKNYCGWSDKITQQIENTEESNGFTITVIPPKSRNQNDI